MDFFASVGRIITDTIPNRRSNSPSIYLYHIALVCSSQPAMSEAEKPSNNGEEASPSTAENKVDDKSKKKNEGNTAAPFPDMNLAQEIHRVLSSSSPDLTLAQSVADTIAKTLENPSLYETFQQSLLQKDANASSSVTFLSADAVETMKEAHKAKVVELEAVVEEAKESAGDMEVMDALLAIARFAAKSLTTQQALDAYQKVLDLPKLSSGKKMDCYMELARVTSFAHSIPATSTGGGTKTTLASVDEWIDKADKLAQSGSGDWDRRNRVAVYKALQFLLKRDLKKSAEIMLQGIATFTSTELCSYQSFLIYAALTNLLHLPRPKLYEKILNGPELLAVAPDIPVVVSVHRMWIVYVCLFVCVGQVTHTVLNTQTR